MSRRIKVNKNGDILIPHELLEGLQPGANYDVVREGNTLKLVITDNERPPIDVEALQDEAKRFWTEKTPEERAAAFREWIDRPRPQAPDIPDEALRRESLYD